MATSSSELKTSTCAEHFLHLADKYKLFYQQKKMFDVTLIAEDDNTALRAHRAFLSASSEYFRQRFETTESNASEVQISNMNGSTLKSVLDFIYTGSFEMHSDTIRNVLLAADLLKNKTLSAACLDIIQEELNTRNCLDFALFAEQHRHTALKAISLAYAYKHFEGVCTEEAFLLLNEQQLNDFLSGEDLQLSSQEKLFLGLIAWYKFDEVKREDIIYSLLAQHVRFALLDITFILQNRKTLSGINKCSELMWSWLEWHTTPAIQKKTTKKLVYIYQHFVSSKLGAQSYNPEINKWSFEDWPNSSSDRTKYTMYVSNKKLIISGGMVNGEVTNGVEYLDLQTLKWSYLPSMISQRYKHCMTELNDNIYVIGGSDGNRILMSVEKYDFSEGTWQTVAILPVPLLPNRTAVLNGLLYVSFEERSFLQRYNPRSNEWDEPALKNKNVSRFGMAAFKGQLYAFGGLINYFQVSRSLERYDPTNDTWTQIESSEKLGVERDCTTWDDRIFICWYSKGGFLDGIINEYNPLSNTWKSLAPCLPAESINMCYAHLTTIE